MLRKVVIVGAGPAGLFAANDLFDSFDVSILESRGYVGGSGLHSDGKLNLHPKIGGDLTEFLSETESWNLINSIDKILADFGVDNTIFYEDKLKRLEEISMKRGIKFIPIKQRHIGSDFLPEVMNKFRKHLEDNEVKFQLNTTVLNVKKREDKITGVVTDKGSFDCDNLLLSPGRIGSHWLVDVLNKIKVSTYFNPIDVGVRVEILNNLIREIVDDYGCWDPKFQIYAKGYDDFMRTFCTCPGGFVVKEDYGKFDDTSIFGVNGYSESKNHSENTNFAFLVRIALTEPLEDTTLYGRLIAQQTNVLGGGKPLIQRLGDFIHYRRSTLERIKKSFIKPTLNDVTPGDISMTYPHRIVDDILDGLKKLDEIIPGLYSNSTLLYAPEVKFYAKRVETDKRLQTRIQNLFVAGDGAGVSRGIIGAAATGIIAARGMKNV